MVDAGTADRGPLTPPAWATFSDEQLLALRMCDLGLSLEGSDLDKTHRAAQRRARGARPRLPPHFWLSDEWFTPDGVPGIAIPFYLAHPRLAKLELAQMLEVEGGDPASCLRILRHEAGHAIDNAYLLRRRPTRRRLFGLPATPYPEYYTPKPYSKSFVQHLDHWYAQSHPDEDFAETFAVWLDPQSMWATRYAGWPAPAQARVHGPADAGARAPAAARHLEAPGRSARAPPHDARRALPAASASTTASITRTSTRATCATCSRTRRQYAKNLSAARFVQRIRKRGAQHGRELHRQLPVHDRPADREDHRALPRAEPAADGLGRGDEDRLHGLPDGADDELPAQRTASGGAVTVSRLRVLALVHRHLVPPDDDRAGHGHHVGALAHRVRRRLDAARDGARGAAARRARRPRRHPPRRRPSGSRTSPSTCSRGSTTSRSSTRTSSVHLELLKLSYTGCNPRGLLLARDKSLSKKLLAYHRIAVPEFEVFRIGAPIRRPKRLAVPAHREVADAGGVDRHLAGVGRRQRREAEGARRVHPREHRHGGHRRAVHRGPRALRRHPRQPAPAGAARVGAVLHEHAAPTPSGSRPTA